MNELESLYKFGEKENKYNINQLVTIDNRAEMLVKEAVDCFCKRIPVTDKQIKFATAVAELIFGNPTYNKVTVVPAKCGFGKSTIIEEAMKVLIRYIGKGLCDNLFDGAIIVTDKIKKLEEMQANIGSNAFLLKHIDADEEMTEDERINNIRKQQAESARYPVLLMSSQRLSMLGKDIENYNTGIDKWDKKHNRTIKIIDEKPLIIDSQNINIDFFSDIKSDIERLIVKNDSDNDNKSYLIKEIQNIENVIQEEKIHLANKKLWLYVGKQNSLTTNDDLFFSLVRKYCKYTTLRKIEHLKRLLTSGGIYINDMQSENENIRYFKTLGTNNLLDSYKTIIFDATSLYDVDYSDNNIFQFLDINDERDFNNLLIHNYPVNMSKTAMKEHEYKKCRVACDFLNRKFKDISSIFLVTYMKRKGIIDKHLNINIVRYNNEIPHFSLTKGKNDWHECTTMIQLGFNRLRDVEYIASYLSLFINLEKLFHELCSNDNKIEAYCNELRIEKGLFVKENINRIMVLRMLVDFEQEIFRTKIRQFNNTETPVNIYCFGMYPEMKSRVEARFNVKVIEESIPIEFIENRVMSRANGDHAKLVFDWYNKWNGKEIHIKEMLESTGLSQKQFNKLKDNNKDVRKLFEKCKSDRRGYYKKAS
jgi:hypothetical protein